MEISKIRKKVFIFIFGPQAVGKMTVGIHLSKLLNYKLIYNHQTIDIALALYPREEVTFINFLTKLNFYIFKSFIRNPSSSCGLIFTDTWLLNREYDRQIKNRIFELFHENGWEVYLIELESPINIRLERNKSETRLRLKPSKQDITSSMFHLINADVDQITNTSKIPNFSYPTIVKKHLIIDTTFLSAETTAKTIICELGI